MPKKEFLFGLIKVFGSKEDLDKCLESNKGFFIYLY